jgi:Ca-activated chloride channel family protein
LPASLLFPDFFLRVLCIFHFLFILSKKVMKQLLILISLSVLLGKGPASTNNSATSIAPITGTVISKGDGNVLIGASVVVKGTNLGTVTGLDGRFSIVPPTECVSLEVSYTGYVKQTLENLCKGQDITVEMEQSAVLEEVTVTAPSRKPLKGLLQMGRSKKESLAAPQAIMTYDNMAAPGAPYTDRGDNWNTEDYALIQENRFLAVAQEPLSTFSIDVDAASYSNMRRFIHNGQQPPKDAIRIEEMINYFDYDYPQPAGDVPFEVVTELAQCPWQPKHQLLHIGLQGKTIPTENLPASNLVFLIDVSGSMNSPNKLPLLRSSFKLLTNQLREQDRVAIVVYAGAAGLVLPPTSGQNKQAIKDALDQLTAGGSTAGGEGIQLAYKTARKHFIEGGNNRVILATDGDFNIGPSSDAALVRMIEKERESGIFLTVLGYGMGNYKDNKMQQLANKGNGNHAYIDNINEAKKVLVTEFGGTVFTIAKDVKIQIEFNPAAVEGYRLIGYENRLLQNEDFNDDKKDAGELGSGHTVTALYEIIPKGVQSRFLAAVDPLKYQQQNKIKATAQKSEEMCTVKLRYKAPTSAVSQKIEEVVLHKGKSWESGSDNFKWSAAVAEFGMLLRDSEYKSDAAYGQAISLAKAGMGEDPNGYRKEFVKMVETMKEVVGSK